MVTIAEALRQSVAYLQSRGIENPRREAEVLLVDLLDADRSVLYARSEHELDESLQVELQWRIEERGAGRPVSQILGYRWFYKHRFVVSSETLTPRPETEQLVSDVLQANLKPDSTILDLCCGGGCIGLSILCERPDLYLHLTDLSAAALEVARRNGAALAAGSRIDPATGVVPDPDRISYFQGDLYEALPADISYAAIVCNPPYIHPDEAPKLEREVRDFEPSLALFHDDPPALYARILSEGRDRLIPGGFMLLELGPLYAAEILKRAQSIFPKTVLKRDLAGLDRYLFSGREARA